MGNTEQADRLQRAAKHIDAIDMGNGTWAHYATETSRYYVVEADELAELCDYLDDEDEQVSRSAYSHWCAGTSSQEMPEGWEPDGSWATYHWRTDSAHGDIIARSATAVLHQLISDGEWPDSGRTEDAVLRDGAWLRISSDVTDDSISRGEAS